MIILISISRKGGTSTDVSRYAGSLEHIFETSTAGVTIQSPQLDINTIAAGGGSILTWRNGLLAVGPESAASDPGPACYRKGGPLTVTDANLLLGRLVPGVFPSVFGPNENEPLDISATISKFKELTAIINKDTGKDMSCEEVALGLVHRVSSVLFMLTHSASFIKVANAAMCGPVRILTEARGFDVRKHDLACFGGAGGQHACSIAEELKIRRVLVHKYSSILSAYGIGLADIVHEEQAPCMKIFSASNAQILFNDCDLLESKARLMLVKGGFKGIIDTERFFGMRYDGSNTTLMVSADKGGDIAAAFVAAHHQEFGFTPTERSILVDELRIRAIGRGSGEDEIDPFKELCNMMSAPEAAEPEKYQGVYFDALGFVQTPIYPLSTLQPWTKLKGPAMIIDNTQTILVTPNSVASILTNMIAIEVKQQAQEVMSAIDLDPIQLSIFRHRFMGVAEQMGRALQKTSVSANIKERLDFSCAIFTPEGDLVANAPHVPAMIGSMAFAVRGQIIQWKGRLKAGDVLLSNAPGKFSSLLNNGGISADIQNYRVRRCSLARSHCHHTCLR